MRNQFGFVALLALAHSCGCNPSLQPRCPDGGCQAGQTDSGSSAGDGGANSDGGADPAAMLRVTPIRADVVVTDLNTDVSESFVATLRLAEVPATWSTDRTDLGAIDPNGIFRTRSAAGGVVRIRAAYQGQSAEALLTVRTSLQSNGHDDGGRMVPPLLVDRLGSADGGTHVSILYPYPQTVFPRGVLAPSIHFATDAGPVEAIRLQVRAGTSSWVGYSLPDNALKPTAFIPEPIWDAALRSASGGVIQFEVTAVTANATLGPTQLEVRAAPGSLKGSVYFMTYDGMYQGVWRAKTATKNPPERVSTGCSVCHSVSANGRVLATGSEGGTGGVFTLRVDGGVRSVAPTPAFSGDSRGLSWAAITPDGKYILRSQSDFWGGINQKAFRVDEANNRLLEAQVFGLGPDISAHAPAVSPDGRFFAFTIGRRSPEPPNANRALQVMRLSIDDSAGDAGQLTFSAPRTIVDNGAAGSFARFPTFLPNTNQIIYQETQSICSTYGGMLPTLSNSCGHYTRSESRMMLVDSTTTPAVTQPLHHLNRGLVGESEWKNYEPFALPFVAGGYFWVSFTSTRARGHDADGKKKLWVAAIDSTTGTTDPSHPAFFLPNQLSAENERGYWALDPCQEKGASCATGDECCDGFCREPGVNEGRVCTEKPNSCSQPQERCRVNSDCCPPFEGPATECLGGFCATRDAGVPEIQ